MAAVSSLKFVKVFRILGYLGSLDSVKCNKLYVRLPALRLQSSSSKSQQNEDDEPIKYTSSKASSWKAKYSRGEDLDDNDKPWYQGLVISLSLGVFLLYFCVFREENDIDEELGKSLYSRIEGLEETQLKISLRYHQDHGLDTTAIEERLQELRAERML